MMLSKIVKKWFWPVLGLFYISVIVIKVYQNGWSDLTSPASIALIVATVALIYNNVDNLRRLIHRAWYWIVKMQFEWQFISNIEADIVSVRSIDEKTVIKWIEDTLNESKLGHRKRDIVVSKINSGFVVYVTPFGINLKVEKYLSEGTWDENQKERILITGHTLINYRQTNRMLQLFLKMFFSKLENSLSGVQDKKYSLRVSSGEMDPDFYKNQFIKGFDQVDDFSIRQKTEGYTVIVNKRFLEIVSEYKDDIVNSAKQYLLQLR
jgi:hypothetical protein